MRHKHIRSSAFTRDRDKAVLDGREVCVKGIAPDFQISQFLPNRTHTGHD